MKIGISNSSQMRSSIDKHLILIVMLCYLICTILSSRWTVLAYGISSVYSKGITFLLYLILIFFAAVKIVGDIYSDKVSLFYAKFYIFVSYSIFIVMSRLFDETMKYTIYWSIIMIGSISAAGVILRNCQKKQLDMETIINDFIIFGYCVAVFRALYVIFLKRIMPYDPLNVNRECAIMLILIPCSVLGYLIYRKKKYIIGVMIFSMVILYSGSRGGMLLCVFELMAICLLWIKQYYKIEKLFLVFLCVSILVYVGIVMFNIGNIQYYVIRALQGIVNNSNYSNPIMDQIARSDSLRSELFNLGYLEFLKSPFIGTGEVYFSQTIEGVGEFNQSAHNFVLETLDCFGLLGLGQLTLIYFDVLITMPKKNKCKSYFIVLSFAFFGYSLVEPLLYEPLIFLTYCIAAMLFIIASNNHAIKLYRKRNTNAEVLIGNIYE